MLYSINNFNIDASSLVKNYRLLLLIVDCCTLPEQKKQCNLIYGLMDHLSFVCYFYFLYFFISSFLHILFLQCSHTENLWIRPALLLISTRKIQYGKGGDWILNHVLYVAPEEEITSISWFTIKLYWLCTNISQASRIENGCIYFLVKSWMKCL